jgi:hypothetical protein
VVAKGWVIRPLPSWFDANLVVHCELEPLFAAKVSFRGLDRHVAEQELDLIELAACQLAKARTCTPQIKRRQLFDACSAAPLA